MSRWLALVPLLALAALAALFVGWSLKRDPEVRPDALVGRPLPAIAVEPLGGGAPRPLNATVEGLTVVNVFASWCAPCRVEHPELMRLRAAGVRVIGVAYKDTPEAARAFLEELGDPYAAVYQDPDGRVGIELGVSGVPETFVVDADGVVRAKQAGPLVGADGEALLAQVRAAAR